MVVEETTRGERAYDIYPRLLKDHILSIGPPIQVRAVEGEEVTVLELRVDPSDVGKVIGRKWPERQLDAAILAAAGMKLRKQITLEVLER